MASGVKVSKMNFELNPRGNLWFNDESTFGHKLLSKMGWSKGKGLGKNEDGIKENIKYSKKDANTGVGWKKNEIPVPVECLEYENILQNLQKHFKNNPEKPSKNERLEKSLEQRSRTARNHLHYHKFVRGKDLIRYSEKDMKSIFLEKPPKPVSEHPYKAPTFDSPMSMNDYFALKMQGKKEEASKSASKTENNLPTKSQPRDENFSRKRKFVSESPEVETWAKAKVKKLNCDGDSPIKHDSVIEKNSESQEWNNRKKKKENRDGDSYIKDDSVIEKNSESQESSDRKKKKENCDGDSCIKDDSVIEKNSESQESNDRKKKKKKSKKNKSRLQQLKSCLKSRTDYDLEEMRNVSFNEQVSYKILDTSLELCEEINDLTEEEPTIDETACGYEEPLTFSDSEEESENEMPKECDNNVASVEGDCCANEEDSGADGQETPQCFDLPKCSGSNFNFWLESQRQASKMKLYKEMAKKIKKNKMLCSTNLLDIKGYGNWGL